MRNIKVKSISVNHLTCFFRDGFYVYCGCCGKRLLQDYYHFNSHRKTCHPFLKNLSVHSFGRFEPLLAGTFAYSLTLQKQSGNRQLTGTRKSPVSQRSQESTDHGFLHLQIFQLRRTYDSSEQLSGCCWDPLYQCFFFKDGHKTEIGPKNALYWLDLIDAGKMICVDPFLTLSDQAETSGPDREEEQENIELLFEQGYPNSLSLWNSFFFPDGSDSLPERFFPVIYALTLERTVSLSGPDPQGSSPVSAQPAVFPGSPRRSSGKSSPFDEFRTRQQRRRQEIRTLLEQKKAIAYVTTELQDGEEVLFIYYFSRRLVSHPLSRMTIERGSLHYRPEESDDEILLASTPSNRAVLFDKEKTDAYLRRHPELLADRYDGRYPLLPLLCPYLAPFAEVAYKSGLPKIADILLRHYYSNGKTLLSPRCQEGTSIQQILGLGLHFLHLLENAIPEQIKTEDPVSLAETDQRFWDFLEKLRLLYSIQPALIDVPAYTPSYRKLILQHMWVERYTSDIRFVQPDNNRFPLPENRPEGALAVLDTSGAIQFLHYVVQQDLICDGDDVCAMMQRYYQICQRMNDTTAPRMPQNLKAALARKERELEEMLERERIERELRLQAEKKDKNMKFLRRVEAPFYQSLSTLSDEQDPESPLYSLPYRIILPSSVEDVIREGKEMHNCVATYVSSIICGSTCILFLREKTDPDRSFVTVEVTPKGCLTQAKSKFNGRITPSVNSFLLLWAQTRHLSISSNDVQAILPQSA